MVGGLLVGAVALVGADWFVRFGGADAIDEMTAAVGDRRPVAGRLAGHWHRERSSTEPWRGDRDPQVLAVSTTFQRRYDANPTPEHAHAAGVAALIVRDFERAIPLLERAATAAPLRARAQNDLAATYLQRALDKGRFEDNVRALAAASRAIQVDGANADARFNQALALRALFLAQQARDAFAEFRKLASAKDLAAESAMATWADQGGADEARPTATPEPVRPEQGERDALAWAAVVCATTPALSAPAAASASATPVLSAVEAATRAVASASSIAAATGDRFYTDVKSAVDAWRTQSPRELNATCRAVDDYRLAKDAYDSDRIQEAGPPFTRAAAALRTHPWGLWSRLHLAILDYYGGRLDAALTTLTDLEAEANRRSFLLLQARALWVRGLIRHTQALYEDSISSYRKATVLMRQAGFVEGEAALQALLADSFDLLAERDAAWDYRRDALSHVGAPIPPRRRHTILRSASRACLELDLPEAALAFQHAIVANAEAWGQAAAISEAYLGRAGVYARLRSQHAHADLTAARTWASRVADKMLAPRLGRELADAESLVNEALDPRAAVDALTVAIGNATQSQASYQLPTMYARRGRAHMALGQSENAERDLSQAIAMAETSRAALRSDLNRRGAFDRTFDGFDAMIELKLRAGRFEDALRYAERGRSTITASPVDPIALGASFGPDTGLLYLVQVRDRLLSFLIASGRVTWMDRTVPLDTVQRLVDRHRAAVSSGDRRAIADVSQPIAALVLADHLSTLRGVRRLAIVPAGPLHGLGFAALVVPGTNRYLVEDYVLVMAPSAGRLLGGTDVTGAKPLSALVVTNPHPATLDGNPLPALPYAERDADTVRKAYAHTTSLRRAEATREAFLDQATRFDVVHYAGHAVSHPSSTGLSRLLLADGADRSGSLFMSDIARLSFQRTRLMVLAACSTAEGRILRGAGTVSLATAFLDVGVPNVIASLWPIEDRQTAALFLAFHEAFARGQAPEIALRQAQLELLTHDAPEFRSPHAWAAFQSIGSISPTR